MKKSAYIALGVIVIIVLGVLVFRKYVGNINVPGNASPETAASGGEALSGFTVPEGFQMSIFAADVPGARVVEVDPKGNIVVSETSEGNIVALLDTNNDGVSDEKTERKILATGLSKPHGLAFKCESEGPSEEKCFLYVAERDMLSRFPYDASKPSLGKQEDLMPIASSATDRHFTRSLLFLPSPDEDTLLISAGSSCDACNEKDTDHASVMSYNIKTGKKEPYAKGLRNATFMALDPLSGKVFATEMGRDTLGDDIPPDEIDIIEKSKTGEVKNYGWPICYGKNIHDTKYDKNTYIRNPCMEPFETESFIDLQAHSAPLGLGFIPEEGWPEAYWYNMLVAYHGSWNRSEPTGYKIVRIKMNAKGEYLGTDDFISGWMTKEGEKSGRPVGLKVLSGGVAYITDDSKGVVYKLSHAK